MTTTPKATQTHLTPNITVPSPAIVFLPTNGRASCLVNLGVIGDYPKASSAGSDFRPIVTAIGRPTAKCVHVPGSAPNAIATMIGVHARRPWRSVAKCARIIFVPAVRTPLPNVADDVE